MHFFLILDDHLDVSIPYSWENSIFVFQTLSPDLIIKASSIVLLITFLGVPSFNDPFVSRLFDVVLDVIQRQRAA